MTEGEQIPLAPSDTEGSALLSAFQTDNLCYTVESVDGNTIVNPRGTLYMTANSASGSKFYELISPQQDYIAERSQNWLPSYSVITITGTSFAIDTYQITDQGDVESIDTTFTIVKDASKPANTPAALASAATLEADGVSYYRLRDVAWSVRGTDAQFNVTWAAETGPVIITGKAYNDYRPVGSCSGELAAMSVTVDGKPVITQAIMAGGNWFVSADFLASLGVKVG